MQKYYSEFAEASYASEYNAVMVIWKKHVSQETYKEIHLKLLQMIKDNKADTYITDIYNLGYISESSREWFRQKVIPRAMQYGLKKVAIITTEDAIKKLHTENLKSSAQILSPSLNVQYFKTFSGALHWLKSQN